MVQTTTGLPNALDESPASVDQTPRRCRLGHIIEAVLKSDTYRRGAQIGVGVEAGGDPSELMAEAIAFFEASSLDGTLYGSGPGKSAGGRLGALGNMLNAARDLIDFRC